MSDPFAPLRNQNPGGGMQPLPAQEVRRRGDRRRRRRTTLQVLGSAAVVAALAGSAVGLANGVGGDPQPAPPMQSQTPRPTPTDDPSPSAIVIPPDYPLTEGWPVPSELGPEGIKGPSADLAANSFTACGKTFGAPGPDAERLTATFQDPEDYRGREIRTYGTESAARAALEEILAGFAACEVDRSEPPTAVHTRIVDLPDGSQVLRMWGEPDAPAVGVHALNLMQKGQALLLSHVSSEGSGFQTASNQAEDDLQRLRSAMTALCVFASDGCQEDPEGKGTPDLTADNLLATKSLTAAVNSTEPWKSQVEASGPIWTERPERNDATLDCQPAFLSTLNPEGMVMREWEGEYNEAATAVLAFSGGAGANAAFDTVKAWLQACERPMAGARELDNTSGKAVAESHAGAELFWKSYTAPAPEVCTECDQMWLDTQGVALKGSRLVVLSIAVRVDLQAFVGTEAPWMRAALAEAVSAAD